MEVDFHFSAPTCFDARTVRFQKHVGAAEKVEVHLHSEHSLGFTKTPLEIPWRLNASACMSARKTAKHSDVVFAVTNCISKGS